MPPHLRPRQIVRPTRHRPHPSLHLRIEHHPVSCIQPLRRDSATRAHPGGTARLTPEQRNIRIGNELPPEIKRVEVNAVVRRHIQPRTPPSAVRRLARVRRMPLRTAVGRDQRPPEVSPKHQLRILLRHPKVQRILSPVRPKPLGDPRVVHVRRGLHRLLPHQLPARAPIPRTRHSVPNRPV